MKKFSEWIRESGLELDLNLDADVEPAPQQKTIKPQTDPTIRSNETNDAIEVSYGDPRAKGYLHAQKDAENPNIYRVIRVTVTPQGMGYGKKLYIAAMRLATRKGAMLAPAKNSTSDSAVNVWKSLHKDPNIEKTPLHPRDWPESPRNQRMLARYTGLRLSDPKTHPPRNDSEFWSFNSGYRARG